MSWWWIPILLAAFWAWRLYRRNAWVPLALMGTRLLMVEKTLHSNDAFAVAGKPDRVYQKRNGTTIPLEYKTRNRIEIRETDIAQLSLQSWLLGKNGLQPAGHGFLAIRLRRNGKTVARRIALRPAGWCESLIQRFDALMSGQVAPEKTRDKWKCKSCGHRGRCQ